MRELEKLNAAAWAERRPFIECDSHILRTKNPTLMREQMEMNQLHFAMLEAMTHGNVLPWWMIPTNHLWPIGLS